MLKLYTHPLSSYCQKAFVALYENDTPFEPQLLDGTDPVASEFAALWPIGNFPILTDGDTTVFEATSIIEHLNVAHPGPVPLIPEDPAAAVEVRMLDRFFDNYVNTPQQRIVADFIRQDGPHDEQAVAGARKMLDTAYAWLDAHLADRVWSAGQGFSLADCAAAPALLYADWTHAIPDRYANLWAYRTRLLARPSYARALDEARPFRDMFPLGAPADRD